MCKCCQNCLESIYWHLIEKHFCWDDSIALYEDHDTVTASSDNQSAKDERNNNHLGNVTFDNLAFYDSVAKIAGRAVVTIEPIHKKQEAPSIFIDEDIVTKQPTFSRRSPKQQRKNDVVVRQGAIDVCQATRNAVKKEGENGGGDEEDGIVLKKSADGGGDVVNAALPTISVTTGEGAPSTETKVETGEGKKLTCGDQDDGRSDETRTEIVAKNRATLNVDRKSTDIDCNRAEVEEGRNESSQKRPEVEDGRMIDKDEFEVCNQKTGDTKPAEADCTPEICDKQANIDEKQPEACDKPGLDVERTAVDIKKPLEIDNDGEGTDSKSTKCNRLQVIDADPDVASSSTVNRVHKRKISAKLLATINELESCFSSDQKEKKDETNDAGDSRPHANRMLRKKSPSLNDLRPYELALEASYKKRSLADRRMSKSLSLNFGETRSSISDVPIIRQTSMPRFYAETPSEGDPFDSNYLMRAPSCTLTSPIRPDTLRRFDFDLRSVVQMQNELEDVGAAAVFGGSAAGFGGGAANLGGGAANFGGGAGANGVNNGGSANVQRANSRLAHIRDRLRPLKVRRIVSNPNLLRNKMD